MAAGPRYHCAGYWEHRHCFLFRRYYESIQLLLEPFSDSLRISYWNGQELESNYHYCCLEWPAITAGFCLSKASCSCAWLDLGRRAFGPSKCCFGSDLEVGLSFLVHCCEIRRQWCPGGRFTCLFDPWNLDLWAQLFDFFRLTRFKNAELFVQILIPSDLNW